MLSCKTLHTHTRLTDHINSNAGGHGSREVGVGGLAGEDTVEVSPGQGRQGQGVERHVAPLVLTHVVQQGALGPPRHPGRGPSCGHHT